MAVTAANVTTGKDGNGPLASIATASVTPGASKLQLLSVHIYRDDSTSPAAPSSVTGCSLTWVLVTSVLFQPTGASRARLCVYRALGTPTTGAVTVTFGYFAARASWTWDEFSSIDTGGSDGSAAVVQSAVGSGESTAPLATLAAFGDAGNATYGSCAYRMLGPAFTAGTGFAELSDDGYNPAQQTWSASEFRNDNDTTVDGTLPEIRWWGMVGVEIKAGAAPTAAPATNSRFERTRPLLIR